MMVSYISSYAFRHMQEIRQYF